MLALLILADRHNAPVRETAVNRLVYRALVCYQVAPYQRTILSLDRALKKLLCKAL